MSCQKIHTNSGEHIFMYSILFSLFLLHSEKCITDEQKETGHHSAWEKKEEKHLKIKKKLTSLVKENQMELLMGNNSITFRQELIFLIHLSWPPNVLTSGWCCTGSSWFFFTLNVPDGFNLIDNTKLMKGGNTKSPNGFPSWDTVTLRYYF